MTMGCRVLPTWMQQWHYASRGAEQRVNSSKPCLRTWTPEQWQEPIKKAQTPNYCQIPPGFKGLCKLPCIVKGNINSYILPISACFFFFMFSCSAPSCQTIITALCYKNRKGLKSQGGGVFCSHISVYFCDAGDKRTTQHNVEKPGWSVAVTAPQIGNGLYLTLVFLK